MALHLFKSPFWLPTAASDTTTYICAACRRHASSFRRTRKALRVKPDPSFAPSTTEPQDHIIFNPPSSAPSVYHTPSKFLPQSDPRRRIHSLTHQSPNSSSSGDATNEPVPASQLPPTRSPYSKKYHLGKDDFEEIRRLRKEDPRQWTRVRLAEKFECSEFFISLLCSAPQMKEAQDKKIGDIKKTWGRKKMEAREQRQARKVLWGRDG